MTAIASPRKLHKLEALRGFAAIYVVLHHAMPHDIHLAGINLGLLFRFGQEAVILFFLISGFVINHSFHNAENKSFKAFFLKRALRIYPPLLAVFAFHYVLVSLSVGQWANPQWQNLLANVLMLQDNIGFVPGTLAQPYMGNTPLWSLSYEWWFYMAFFYLATRVDKHQDRCRIVFLGGFAASVLYIIYPHFLLRLPMYFAIWWVGVELSHQYLSKQSPSFAQLKPSIACLGSIAGALAVNAALGTDARASIVYGVSPFLELRHFAFALIVLIGTLLWSRWNWYGFDGLFGSFAVLAPMSYVLYIGHYKLFSILSGFAPSAFLASQWIVGMLGLFAFAYMIEMRVSPWVTKQLTARLKPT